MQPAINSHLSLRRIFAISDTPVQFKTRLEDLYDRIQFGSLLDVKIKKVSLDPIIHRLVLAEAPSYMDLFMARLTSTSVNAPTSWKSWRFENFFTGVKIKISVRYTT